MKTGDATTPDELSHTSVKRFLNDANTIGGSYILYAFVYDPLGSQDLYPFLDNDNVPRIYYRCTVDGSKWELDAKKRYYKGNITLDECWLGN